MYINYQPKNDNAPVSVSVAFSRNVEIPYGDIWELVDAYQMNKPIACRFDGVLDALEDGQLWAYEDMDAVENLHADIRSALAKGVAE